MSAQRRERQAARQAPAEGPGRRWVRLAEAGLWIAVAGLFLVRVVPQVKAAVGWRAAGTDAPAVSFAMLDGRDVPLESLRGQVVLVNFWATWCPPCRAEMPGFQDVYDARHAAGFTVVGVSMDEGSRQSVATFLRDHGIRYPVALATSDVVAAFGGIDTFPTSILIDRQGRIRYTVRGYFAETALRSAVGRLLAER